MSERLRHWKELMNTDYIGAYSLQPDEERVVEIVSIESKDIVGEGGKKDKKGVAHLKNEKPMILNATNNKRLAKLFGSHRVEHWVGKKFTVRIEIEKDQRTKEPYEALRVKPELPKLPELTPSNPKWADAVKALRDGKGIDVIESRYTLTVENRELLISEAI